MKYYTIILLVALCSLLRAQKLKIGIESGIATFSMKNLKDLNQSAFEDMTISAKIVDDFPPTIYYRPSISWLGNNMSFGLLYTYTTTGSRISSKDYSGEYRFDIVAHAHSPALQYNYIVNHTKNYDLTIRAIGGFNLSSVCLQEYFDLYDKVFVNEEYNLESLNFFIEPGLGFTYPIKRISIETHLGYHFVLSNEALHLKDNKEATLKNTKTGEKIKPAWDGLRIGIGVSYFINKN